MCTANGSRSFLVSLICVGVLALVLSFPSLHDWHDSIYTDPSTSSASSASRQSGRPVDLERFLHARDADEALAAAQLIGQSFRSSAYQKSLRLLIEKEWLAQPQGIYNLLQHSYMLPADLRFSTLLKGINEPRETQYQLAAAVGMQFTPRRLYELEENRMYELMFRAKLLERALQEREDDFLAARAFLGVKDLLQHERDTRHVLTLLGGLNWRNCLTWLLKHVHTQDDPLTSQRLHDLLLQTKHDSTSDHNSSPGKPPVLPDQTAWDYQWETALRNLDVEKVMEKAGPVLEEHWERMKKGEKSRILEYQEIEIPSYAPLIQGEIGEDGIGRIRPGVDVNTAAEMKDESQQQKRAPPAVTFTPTPDVVVQPRVIEDL